MKKTGFTLIEILAVIVILAIILAVSIPAISGIITSTYNNAYDIQLKLIKKAAQTYVGTGGKALVEGENKITLNELTSANLISVITDPIDKTTSCDAYVTATKTSSNITYDPYMKCGSNYTTAGYTAPPVYANANIHQGSVPGGYTGIYKIEDLNNVRNNLAGQYILMNNLDFNSDSSYTNPANKTTYTTGSGWLPLGDGTTNFTGIFNGNNYTINNMYINRAGSMYNGLFGYVGNGATIEKLGLGNINITGGMATGGLAGRQGDNGVATQSIIRNCYTTGTITSASDRIGGMVGFLNSSGRDHRVSSSYSTVNVTGNNYVGGLIGDVITSTTPASQYSFATGNVTATAASGAYYGRLIGRYAAPLGPAYDSYYSRDSTITGNGTLTIAGELASLSLFKSYIYTKYRLAWDVNNIWFYNDNQLPTLGGTTGSFPAINHNITKIEDLFLMNYDLAGSFNLMNNLDFNNDGDYRNVDFKYAFTSNKGWLPIGWENPFTGTFNGNGHTVRNLYINRVSYDSGYDYIGLFGRINSNSVIEKLGLENINITSEGSTGGLVCSASNAIIRNVYITGNINNTYSPSYSTFGGLVSTLGISGSILNSYSAVNITSTVDHQTAGGLVGVLNSGQITNSYAVGNISTVGTSTIYGKLIGNNGNTITSSYYNSGSTITGQGTEITGKGTSATTANLQALTPTGLNAWDTTAIWQINAGAYPTHR